MTTTQRSMIVGLFTNSSQAEQAVHELQHAGFQQDQIEFAGHQSSTGNGLLAHLESLFGGHGTTPKHLYDELVARGMPAADAHTYQQKFEAGQSIVAVSDTNPAKLQEARSILARYGAAGANQPATSNSATTVSSGTAASTTGAAGQAATDIAGEQNLELRQEQLRVYKRPVQEGEVELHKEVVSEQQTIDVPVTHEEVYVERHPASGPAQDTTPIGESETIRIPVHQEEVDVTKQTVVTEEVEVGKRQVQDTEHVEETVRHEVPEVQVEGSAPIHDTTTDPFHPSNKNVEDLLNS